ncbi:NAD(P)H-dependent oxidoreductase [Gudongella sp. DL1XJH-153]|uniref:NAD(P)H-dependent oxidoreductase n=1 Tax=Gudongella sp. DL1XJH-153 TaxID=3409804 RepID=UPI003BB48F79
MFGLRNKLGELEESNNPIKVCLVGAGLMGKGLVSQLTRVDGMTPSVVVSNKIQDSVDAFTIAGIHKSDIVIARNTTDIDNAVRAGKFVATDLWDMAVRAGMTDVIVDATGVPDTGARIATTSILEGKDIVMLNVEADVVVGPYLNRLAKQEGVVYTGSAGDEPGAVMELYDFAVSTGFKVLALGKGKNNPLDHHVTPQMVRVKAEKSGLKPLRLASFIDGTNTMVEMAAMANASGFVPDVRGGHGPDTTVDQLPKVYSLKSEGGILNRYGIVDFAFGAAPGVYAIVTTDLPQVHHEMKFLKMGDGPNYVLFRPYHLTSLETPITIAKAHIYREPSIVPMMDRPVAEVITMAKKDIKKGEYFDGIGEETVYGSIEEYNVAKKEDLVPIGLINRNARARVDIKKDEYITNSMIELDTDTEIYKLRQLQDEQTTS